MQRIVIISSIALALSVSTLFAVLKTGVDVPPEKALNSFSRLIEQGRIGDLSLTVYYSDEAGPRRPLDNGTPMA